MNYISLPFLLALLTGPVAYAPAPTVEIQHDSYVPASLTVTAGESVTFKNEDDDAHTVTAIDGAFDSKGLDTNAAWRYTFSRPGTYRYFCELHPFMKGTIVVKAVPQ